MTVFGTGPARAQDTRYRVEILVLTLLEQDEDSQERAGLTDYSMATDFLTPTLEVEESADGETAEQEPLNEVAGPEEILPADGEMTQTGDVVAAPPDPNRLTHIEEMSSHMQEAWRRLRLSGPYRPEQFLSWEQGNQEPFPVLRLHDLASVLVDDPWAGFRTESGESATVFADAAGLDSLETAGELEGPALPDPVYYYRLDGAVTLRRSRFLHLDLDLQLREAVWEQDLPVAPETANTDGKAIQPSSFRVHELKQSRQVRSGRMEYFDGPVLGVLAWITEIDSLLEAERKTD